MNTFRKLTTVLAILSLLSLLLAACGGGDSAPKETAGAAAATASVKPSEQPTPTPTPVPTTRTIKDAKNREVAIPVNPQRVVAHYFPAEVVALGVKPVGTNYITAKQILTEAQLQGAEDIGGQGTDPNLEKVLSLEPDLILVPDFVGDPSIEALSKIAPTVVVSYSLETFAKLKLIGDLLGKTKEADAWIAAYEAKAKKKQDEIKSYVKEGETASAMIYHVDKKLYVYGKQRLGPTMYDALGFAQPEKVKQLTDAKPNDLWHNIQAEVLEEYAGDVVFFVVNQENPDVKAGFAEIQNHPVWKNLPAVKNGRAYIVGSRWAFNDPLTLDWLLDEMPKLLMEKK